MDAPDNPEKDPLQFLLAIASGLQQIHRNPEGDNSGTARLEAAPSEPVSAAMPALPVEDESFGQEHATTESMAAFLKEFDQLVESAGAESSSDTAAGPNLATEAAGAAQPSLPVLATSAPQEAESRQLTAETVPLLEHKQEASSPVELPCSPGAEVKKRREAPFYAAFQRPVEFAAGAGAVLLLIATFVLLTSMHQKAAAPPARRASASSLPQHAENPSSASLTNAPASATEPVLVSAVRPRSSRDSSQVEVALNQSVTYEARRLSNPERVYFDLANSRLAPDLDGKTLKVRSGMITRIRMAERENTTARITLQTGAAFDYSAEILPHPYRLLIHLRSQQPSRATAGGSPDEHGGNR